MQQAHKRDKLRTTLRKERRQLSPFQKKLNAHKLVTQLIHIKVIKQAKNIAVYLSNDGEIDLKEVIKQLWKANKNCYLPVLSKKNKGHLLFIAYTKDQKLIKNCFKIYEPAYNYRLSKTAKQMDVILMPLVGFDKYANRIGMGGGYYDRSLSLVNTKAIKPRLIGVAHSIQQIDQIPMEKWDIKLDKMVTEKGEVKNSFATRS